MSCCSNDLCNTGPDLEELNGQYCLGCLHMLNDFKCNRTGVVHCKGSQTKCGSLRSVHKKDGHNITIDFQGCVSESVCLLVSTKIIFGAETGKQFECCDGHLCNGSSRLESVPVALLVLCLYLLVSNNN
ncbi:phospholipase A2 inhibitor gamma subunit B-like [Mustelus asterias]